MIVLVASDSPEVMRRRLRTALRQHRLRAGLTQKDVAQSLDWSTSKIVRIEQGIVGITRVDLQALLVVYQVTDEQQVAELVELARGSRKQSGREYSDVYSRAALELFANEAAAKVIYKYEPTFIPGLLQAEEYTRALLSAQDLSPQHVERIVESRQERQELLDRKDHPQLQFIIDEAALRRVVGGPKVMGQQLEMLKYVSTRPGIFLYVLPFSAGAHPRIGAAFTILQFADQDVDDLLYLENPDGEYVSREDPDLIAAYVNDFLKLQEMSSESDSFAKAIESITANEWLTLSRFDPKTDKPP